MAFPHLGDTITVAFINAHGKDVDLTGALIAIRPRAQEVIVRDHQGKDHKVPWQNIIDRYGE